ncbi:hypothetical protein HHK36_007630 [Tetracentron sinense]|uniref:protein-serine/threonine phosphatase n=1 Tax=Tetracentron sinense TaxID=13715 RepID=A0A834ZMY2_TETSI|nr:hypothetical protein HHK36_007630 [Tetracentron sinense]
MRVAGSIRFILNPLEKETLAKMAKDGNPVEDMEEGEISDSASVEEISEVNFKQDARISKSKGDSRSWMTDLKYPVSSSYSSGLYNLAWAQAVQNKPLDEILEVCKVIIDDSSEEIDSRMEDTAGREEEGELEEGEIEMDSEIVQKSGFGMSNDNSQTMDSKMDSKESEMEFEKQINSIRETLEIVTANDAEQSFYGVCSKLRASLESLQLLVLGSHVPALDALVRQLFTAIQVVNSMFCSMNLNQQEHNKDFLSRLLAHVESQNPVLFSSEQMKEVETMMRSLDSQAVLSRTKALDKEKEIWVSDGVNMNYSSILAENTVYDLNRLKKFQLEPISGKSLDQNDACMGSEVSKPGMSFGSKGRGGFGPLLDLHRDHDADSLPSPTREIPPPLPLQKSQDAGDRPVRSDLATVAHKTEDTTMHPYETDALKAVSTYQQKFCRTSFILSSRLPSPTPSVECDDGDGDNTNEEVSRLVPARNIGQMGPGSNPVVRALTKSRDPRLRYANTDVGALDPIQLPLSVECNAPKSEPLGGIMSSSKHKIQWLKLENGGIGSSKRQDSVSDNLNVTISVNQQIPLKGTGTTVYLPSLLKDIAVNPTLLMHLIKMEQPRAAETQQRPLSLSKNQQENITFLPKQLQWCVLPYFFMKLHILFHFSYVQIIIHPIYASRMITKSMQVNCKALLPIHFYPSLFKFHLYSHERNHCSYYSLKTQGELGKIRMKPRDPRRILRNNTFQNSENFGSEHFKTNGALPSSTQGSKDNLTVRQQGEQAETNIMASPSTLPPDIARQFTTKLKNLADILSASQATNTPTIFPQVASSQPVPFKTDKGELKAVATDFDDQRSGTGLTPVEVPAEPFKSQNTWGDVEHLFEGYDDQQKAAIQRERARRIEEQNKMFAVRKLCLVLDLDHTLLNSAKFVEVEPQHEEVLRKNEEQDRGKPQRHLFRFPHMGMWTKLRPGVWNFLEKASKLYELHLYTMGNKLYAREMAKVLDPTGVLFAGRIISKGDDGDPFDSDEKLPKNKDLDGVLGMESAVVIIDDSIRVWPHNKLNLIVVERYTYFPSSRRQFGLPGLSLLEADVDERLEDGTLASSLAVIERIHQIFFSHGALNDMDVRNILASEQRKILDGCRIVFSRVFPVGETNPHLHPLWQTAEQFGAICTNQIDEHVTHVVANCLGTDKVNWALSTGRFVVQPGWVEASTLLYRRANELDYAVKL